MQDYALVSTALLFYCLAIAHVMGTSSSLMAVSVFWLTLAVYLCWPWPGVLGLCLPGILLIVVFGALVCLGFMTPHFGCFCYSNVSGLFAFSLFICSPISR